MAFIYRITNKINDKSYIGKTIQTLIERFDDHKYQSKYKDTYFYRAIKKYGIEQFHIETICECSINDIDEKEKYYIDRYNTLAPNGYNITVGGTGGDTSKSYNYQKYIDKVRVEGLARGSNNNMYGKRRNISQENLDKLREGARRSNKRRVVCSGMMFESIMAAEKAFPNVSVRKRLDSKYWNDWYRIDTKIKRK